MKNKRELKHFLQTLAIVVIGVVLYWGLANYKVVEHWLALLFGVLSPFIIGFVLALMLNVPMSFIERNLFRPKKGRQPRKTVGENSPPRIPRADLRYLRGCDSTGDGAYSAIGERNGGAAKRAGAGLRSARFQ